MGIWPCRGFTVGSARARPCAGSVGRHGPNSAADNDYVYGEILGYSSAQIREADDDIV